MFGRLTAQAKSKLKARRTGGKNIVSLDTDSEDEPDVGVRNYFLVPLFSLCPCGTYSQTKFETTRG